MVSLVLALPILAAEGPPLDTTTVPDHLQYCERLQGTWQVVSLQQGGEDPLKNLGADLAFKLMIDFRGNKATIRTGLGGKGQKEDVQSKMFRVNTDVLPMRIDFYDHKDKVEVMEASCIFRFSGENLEICSRQNDPKQRPRDFTAAKDSGNVLMTLKREKK